MFYTEFHRALAAPSAQQFAADLNEVLRTALYLLVSVPAYLLASVVFAASIYLRLAMALLVSSRAACQAMSRGLLR